MNFTASESNLNDRQDYTLVVPVYNEEMGLTVFYDELVGVLKELRASFEILFVDDGSEDRSFEIICRLSRHDPRVRGIALSRNFGHQAAINAGIERAKGRSIMMMDSDLQHPPGLIPTMIERQRQGFEVVYTIRKDTSSGNFFKRISSVLFYRCMNLVSDTRISPATADFRLLGPRAVAAYRGLTEKARFTRGLVQWIGFRQTGITFEVSRRFAGRSKYGLRRMLALALDGITAFSSKPLRASFLLGCGLIVTSMLYTGYIVFAYFFGKTQPGWASILIAVLTIGGVQLLSVGVLGEYVGRIFNEVKNRPLYIVERDTEEDQKS